MNLASLLIKQAEIHQCHAVMVRIKCIDYIIELIKNRGYIFIFEVLIFFSKSYQPILSAISETNFFSN